MFVTCWDRFDPIIILMCCSRLVISLSSSSCVQLIVCLYTVGVVFMACDIIIDHGHDTYYVLFLNTASPKFFKMPDTDCSLADTVLTLK